MNICLECRDKYFSTWDEVGKADICEICGKQTEIYEVTILGLKSGLFLHRIVRADEKYIPVFAKDQRLNINSRLNENESANSKSLPVRAMDAFGSG